MNTDNNFDFLVEYITSKVVEMLVNNQKMDIEEALLLFHNSETFEKLCIPSTGMYVESPSYVYDTLMLELKRGSIRGIKE